MKKRVHTTTSGLESRWFMILPVAAMALACDSTTETRPETQPAQEPASEQNVVQALQASSANAEAAQAGSALPLAADSAVAAASVAASSAGPSAANTSAAPTASANPRGSADPKEADPKEASAVDAAPRRGLAASGEGFSTWLEGKGSYTLNQAANLELVLTAEEPYKCNEQYPYRFNATPGAGVTFATNPVRTMNVGKQRSTMSIPFTPTATGNQTVTGELSFSVCTEDKCLIEKQSLSIVVNVQGS